MRLSRDQWAMQIAIDTSRRGTCIRRKVGCVLLNARGHILATGYNGPASGEPHCIEFPCAGAGGASGTALSVCEAIHAEPNSLLQCRDVHEIDTAYSTTSPCIDCVKLFLNTSCRRIVYLTPYAEPHLTVARERWLRAPSRLWEQIEPWEGMML